MMQSQGLGALMPQAAQQMAPQQADPQRLAAATNLVSSDAERQILDPRTLALIKYKDAIQAMQAADQMMAAAQPAPMPPTVAERTKLAAEQGIAGLASKLGAGIQQQGSNMQAQQLQQAMSGGLPQLPAPNMAGMAQGGIVGFQEGGRPEDKILFVDELGNPVYASDVARAMNAGAIDETPEGIERRAQYEAMQGDRVNLRDLAQTPARQEPRDQTPVPSTTYGTGDRTGQGENLRGMAEGVASLIGDRARSAVSRIPEMPEAGIGDSPRAQMEALSQLYTQQLPSGSGERRSRLPEMSEEELLALTTSEGSGEAPRPDRPSRMDALKETLGRDLAFLAPTQGFGVRPEPQNIFARGKTQAEAPEVAPATESGEAPVGRLATPELEQIEAEIESDPNAFERLASWVAENPYDAVSMGLIAIPGIGLAGGLGMRGVSMLLRSPAVRRAVQSLYSRANPRTAPVFDAATNTMTRGAAGSARVFSPGRAMFTAGTGMTAAGQVANMMGGDGDGEGLASIPLGPTPATTQAEAPAAVAPAPATTTTTPRARDSIPADQAVAAMSPSGPQTAADYLMEYGQAPEEQPRAGESAADRDARRRMLIAGLRGFGAQGLGGFAAGTAEEELRQEQEVIADQERRRRAGIDERELSLKDRELTLMNEIRRQQLDADIRQRSEQALLRMEALGSAERQFVQEQIGERTNNIDQMIQNFNLSLISGNVRGRDADALRNQILALQEQKANIIEEALINLEQPDRSGAIRALEEAAYGGSGRGFNPDDFTVRQASSQ